MTQITDLEILDIYHKMLMNKSYEIKIDNYSTLSTYKVFMQDLKKNTYRGIIARSVDFILEHGDDRRDKLINVITDLKNEITKNINEIQENLKQFQQTGVFHEPKTEIRLQCSFVREQMELYSISELFAKFEMNKSSQIIEKQDNVVKSKTLQLMYDLMMDSL